MTPSLRRFTGALLVLVLAANVSACGTARFRKSAYNAFESSRGPTFEPELLGGKRVGVLSAPVPAGEQTYKRLTGDLFVRALQEMRPEVEVLSIAETLNRINQQDLMADYIEMNRDYEATGIMDRKALTRIGRALGTTLIFRPALVDYKKERFTRLAALGLRLLDTQESSVRVFLQVWDTRTGEILWEGTGTGIVTGEMFRQDPIYFEDITNQVWKNVISKLMGTSLDESATPSQRTRSQRARP